MNDDQLKQHLMALAHHGGICADGYRHMADSDRRGLIAYYLSCPDWCLERGIPDIDTLRSLSADIEDCGIFVDRDFDGEVFDARQVYVFHHCRGLINVAMDYSRAVIPMLYFANGCDITVSCTQANSPAIKVPLYVVAEPNNIVCAADTDGCVFSRHIINPLQL